MKAMTTEARTNLGYTRMNKKQRVDKAIAGVGKRASGLELRRGRLASLQGRCHRVKSFFRDALANVTIQPEAHPAVRQLGKVITEILLLIQPGRRVVGAPALTSAEAVWDKQVLAHFRGACAALGIEGGEAVVTAPFSECSFEPQLSSFGGSSSSTS